mgnify:CR=1 FL=1|tara:strand:+ start:85 stop:1059 length:975 start_codon:yes stop_codon:yes gene_type:complete
MPPPTVPIVPHPAVVVLLIAIVTSLAGRAARRLGLAAPVRLPAPTRRGLRHVKVLLAAPVRAPWRDALLHLLRQAAGPLRFGVLLECTRPSDAALGELESDLRPIARVVHARAPKPEHARDPARRTRRLVRRFVAGDEGLVVLLDYRVRVMPGWDAACAELLRGTAAACAVLSAPAAAKDGVPAYPTRRARTPHADGSVPVCRGVARRFEAPPAALAVPSVCWCAEFTAARPQALQGGRWPARARGASAVAQSEDAALHHLVAALPLVDADDRLEAEYVEADAGHAGAACGAHERVGLTRDADDVERIQKFGGSRAAKLAVAFS